MLSSSSLSGGGVLHKLQTIFWIALKEFRSTVRDPYVVLYLVCPFVLFPLALWGGAQFAAVEDARLEKNPPRVATRGDGDLAAALAEQDFLSVEASEADIAAGKADILVDTEAQGELLSVRIHHSSTRPDSRRALDPVRDAVKEFRQQRREQLVAERGLDPGLIKPMEIVREEIGTENKGLARTFGFLLSMLMMTSLVLGTLYPALNLLVTEREGASLETTMLLPVPASLHVLGKWTVCALWALVYSAVGGVGLTLTAAQVWTMMLEQPIDLPQEPLQLAAAFLVWTCAAAFVAAFAMAVVSPARNFKQGEVLATFVMMPPLLILAMVGALGLYSGDRDLAFLPVASAATALGDAISGELTASATAWSCGLHLVLAVGFLALVTALFRREDYIAGQFSVRSLIPWRTK